MDKEKLRTLLIYPDTSIKSAMQKLNETAVKILFVVDTNDIILGTVTDGDIRRGIINGVGFGEKIENVACKKYSFVRTTMPGIREQARKVMLEREIEHIPVLDDNGKIIDVILWTDFLDEGERPLPRQLISTPVVIMSGGKGVRLDPFTKILPKPLIPIGDKPIIEIIMEKLYSYGFHNFILTLNYKKEYIKMFIRENMFPFSVTWVEEKEYMGSAGSLSLLRDSLNESFIITNCDTILNADYLDIMNWHRTYNNLITIVGCHEEVKIPYGILEMKDGTLANFIEKPNYDFLINTGFYVLEPEVLPLLPDDKPTDMNVLIRAASERGRVSVYPVHKGWHDVGQWDDYKRTVKQLSDIIG